MESVEIDQSLINEGDLGADFIEQFLDILDYDGDIDIDVVGGRAQVSLLGDSEDLTRLVGRKGEVLDALQDLTRLWVQKNIGKPSFLMLDIVNYRNNLVTKLSVFAREVADSVLETQRPQKLEPMCAFERKVIHDTIAEIDGVNSHSEGSGQNRSVIVTPESA